MRSTLVLILSASCCPAAIAGLVVAAGVWVAIQGMVSAGPLAHVSKECCEVVPPSFAHSDASATTIVVGNLTLTDFIARVNAVDPEVEAIKAAVAALIAQLQAAADPSIYADTIAALQAFLASL